MDQSDAHFPCQSRLQFTQGGTYLYPGVSAANVKQTGRRLMMLTGVTNETTVSTSKTGKKLLAIPFTREVVQDLVDPNDIRKVSLSFAKG